MNQNTNQEQTTGAGEHCSQRYCGVLLVAIKVNGAQVGISPGPHTGLEIKKASGQPQAFELLEVQGGKLVPIADEKSVEIWGCENFIAHPCEGTAS